MGDTQFETYDLAAPLSTETSRIFNRCKFVLKTVDAGRFGCYPDRKMETTKCILIIDDDPLVAACLEQQLESEGFHVVIAGNCADGKEILAAPAPVDLVILDHMLPDGRGTDLLQVMGNDPKLQDPPVILSSSLINPHDPGWRALLQRLPAEASALIQAYVQKPYSFDNMLSVMDLVFHACPAPVPQSNVVLTGDYRHPRRRAA